MATRALWAPALHFRKHVVFRQMGLIPFEKDIFRVDPEAVLGGPRVDALGHQHGG